MLGTFEGEKYEEYEFVLEKGMTLLLYTDGVPDAQNANQDLFGMDRLVEVANSFADNAPKDLLENIHNKVNEFVGDAPQFDDLTILAINILK